MINNLGILSNLKHYKGFVRNGSRLGITQFENTTRSGLKLREVLVVLKITTNLLSVSKVAKDNCCTVEFD